MYRDTEKQYSLSWKISNSAANWISLGALSRYGRIFIGVDASNKICIGPHRWIKCGQHRQFWNDPVSTLSKASQSSENPDTTFNLRKSNPSTNAVIVEDCSSCNVLGCGVKKLYIIGDMF